jgi:predicted small lipoprotein YifL
MRTNLVAALALAVSVTLAGLAGCGARGVPPKPPQTSDVPEQAAEQDFPHLIAMIQGDARGFNFPDEAAVSRISLGPVFEIYGLDDAVARGSDPDAAPGSLVEPLEMWYVPVLLDGRPKGLATLAYEEGRLRFVAYGSNASFAANLLAYRQNNVHLPAGERVKLLHIFPIDTVFALDDTPDAVIVTRIAVTESGIPPAQLPGVAVGRRDDLLALLPQIQRELALSRGESTP